MNFIASNADSFPMPNSWPGMPWMDGVEQVSMQPTMAQKDVSNSNNSMISGDVWSWKKTISDVEELLDDSAEHTDNHGSKLLSTSLSSGSGGKSSSSSSSSSSPSQLFEFEQNELQPTLKSSKSTSSFFSTSPTFDGFGSMLRNNRNSFTPHTQQISINSYGPVERPHSAASDNRAFREYTETVAVESSACVAQIVGKNGELYS